MGIKRALIGSAASLAIVGGLALTAPAAASAAPASYAAPGLTADQGDFGDANIKVTITNPNVVSGVLDVTACAPALLEGEAAVRALLAFEAENYDELYKIVTSKDVKTGNAAVNSILSRGPNTATTQWQVPDGVYLVAGVCGGGDTFSDPSGVGVALKPMIVPTGIGSIGPGLAFGSVLLNSGDQLGGMLPKLLASPMAQGVILQLIQGGLG